MRPSDRERLGIVEEGERRRLLYHGPAKHPISAPRPILVVKPIYEKGRYVPKSLDTLIAHVATMADTFPEAICGLGHRRTLVHARSVVAVLAAEFCRHQSCGAVDDALLRGHGMCIWYRDRHTDRLALYPAYAALYERCRDGLVQKEATP